MPLSTPERIARVQAIADRFAQLPEIIAVALAGSLASDLADEHSDLDIYVYAPTPVSLEARTAIAHEFAGEGHPSIEINKPFWGPEDAWIDQKSGLGVDLIYWSPEWIEDQIDRTLIHHQAWMGYTTSFWYTVLQSQPVFDREGWYTRLKQRTDQPYPEALRRAIVALNYPVLRAIGSSYWHQIALAIARHDRVSMNHRITALLASYFDILFAVNRVPNPGEKRLVKQAKRLCTALPEDMDRHIEVLLCGLADPWEDQRTLTHLEILLENLDGLLEVEELITSSGNVILG